MILFYLTQLTELSWLHTFLEFFQKHNFLKRQETKVSSRDIYVTFSIYAKYSFLINLA